MKCLNCDQTFEGAFCPQCGQKSKTKRLSFFSVIKDFMDALSDSDKGFLKTVIDLSQNPGQMLNDYIDGKRQRYLSAGKYTFFLVVTFTVSISYFENHFGFFEGLTNNIESFSLSVGDSKNTGKVKVIDENGDEKVAKPNSKNAIGLINVADTDEVLLNFDLFGKSINRRVSKKRALEFLKELLPHYHRTLFDYMKFLIVLWIPIFSFFSYLFFYRSPYNFAEHITINSYLYAHILFIFLILSPTYWLMPQMSGTTLMVTFCAGCFFLIYAYMQVFNKRRYRLIKSLLSLSFAMTFYITVLFSAVGVMAAYIAMQNIHLL